MHLDCDASAFRIGGDVTSPSHTPRARSSSWLLCGVAATGRPQEEAERSKSPSDRWGVGRGSPEAALNQELGCGGGFQGAAVTNCGRSWAKEGSSRSGVFGTCAAPRASVGDIIPCMALA